MADICAVVFDMYDTLVPNPKEAWIETFKRICDEQSLDVTPTKLYDEWKALELEFRSYRLNMDDPYKSPPFKSYEQAWCECFARVYQALGISGDPASASKAAVLAMTQYDPFDEVPRTLQIIQSRWQTGILSNADDDYLFPLLDRLGLKFPVVHSSEMAQAYKPHPLPFHRILSELGVKPEESVYVGDNPFDDVLGAKSVGMGTVWINRNRRTRPEDLPEPDYEITGLDYLPGILERWNDGVETR